MIDIRVLEPWKRAEEKGGSLINPASAGANAGLLFKPWGVLTECAAVDMSCLTKPLKDVVSEIAANPNNAPGQWTFFETLDQAKEFALKVYENDYKRYEKYDYFCYALIKPIGSKEDILAAFANMVKRYEKDFEIHPADFVEAIQENNGTKKGVK